VIVQADHGYNAGFVDHEILLPDPDVNLTQVPRILSQLTDEDYTIRGMLKSKICDENYALDQCKLQIQGKKLAVYSEIISTEFRFDRKKLFIYVKKYAEVSVCALVRSLFDLFHVRIKVLEVENANAIRDMMLRYHDLAQLNLSLGQIDSETLAYSFLSSKRDPENESDFDSHTPSVAEAQMREPKPIAILSPRAERATLRGQCHSAPQLGHQDDHDTPQSFPSLDSFETRTPTMPPHPFHHTYTSFLVLHPSDLRPSTNPVIVIPPVPAPTPDPTLF
jgi:hypothetical protein